MPRAALAARRSPLRTRCEPGGGSLASASRSTRTASHERPRCSTGAPRRTQLRDRLPRAAGGTRSMAIVDAVLSAAQRRAPTHPNVDFALAALGLVTNMPQDAGEVIFAVARMAGWIAHAIEEYGE